MKLVPYDLKKVENAKAYRPSKNQIILEEFLESDMNCAKIEEYTQKKAFHCAYSLNKSIKRFRMTGVRAISRNGEVYLIKTSALK